MWVFKKLDVLVTVNFDTSFASFFILKIREQKWYINQSWPAGMRLLYPLLHDPDEADTYKTLEKGK